MLGGFYAVSQLGPGRYENAAARKALPKEEAEKLRRIAEESEAAWNAARLERTNAKKPFTDDDLKLLGEAAAAARQYEEQADVDEEHYPALRKELHDRMGARLREESIRLEKLAVVEERERRYPEAEKYYASARAIEEQINSEYVESSARNLQRTSYLISRVNVMQAKPIWDRSLAGERAAEDAFAKGDLKTAVASMSAAFEDTYRLERDYRGLTPADSFRTRKLERRLDTMKSIVVRDLALSLTADAEKAAAARRFSELPQLRREVEEALHEIANKHPESEYAKKEYLDEILRRVQNAASAADAEAVEKALAAFGEAARRGDPASSAMTEGLQRSVLRVRELYPQSDRVGPEMVERIAFLFTHREELAVVGAYIRDALRPMPGAPAVLVARTETPQRLYSLVTGENPSATKGEDRPVESVTRDEALLFCKRLGWMIGRTVRLPDEGEFRAMVGKVSADTLPKIARGIDNSDGSAGKAPAAAPDANGFNDLLGNVSEWLAPSPDQKSGTGRVAGGDAETTLSQLGALPVRDMPSGQRSRFTGFRFLVEPVTTR